VSYRVFARKYRPQKFEEVVGQEHITRTLQNAIKGNRLAQAYLFVGPRGVGKTSSARILAKALNCLSAKDGPTDNPCGTCDVCVEIAEGRSLDVMEIDGASNNGVDSIRTLRENAAYAPARGPYKVYLIDEVHMLSAGAFNALLKTLEEPPEHVKFLFATTEAQKVPATILSRCQRFDLRRLTTEQIAAHLLYIATNESITLDPAAADAIARGADGAMRDAESMLDQAVSFCGSSISAADVHSVFGFTPRETVLDLGLALVNRDTPAALALIKSQAEAGKDLSRLLADLVGLLRDVLIAKVHPPERSNEETKLGDSISQEKLLSLLDHFGEAEGRLRWATDKKLQLDVALIKAAHLLEEASLSDVLDVLASLRGGSTLPEQRAMVVPKLTTTQPVAKIKSPAQTTATRGEDSPKTSTATVSHSVADSTVPTQDNPAPISVPTTDLRSTASIDNPWDAVALSLAADSPLKFGWLEDGRFVELNGTTVAVEFPPSIQSQTETLFWPQAVKKIEEQLSAKLGKKITLQCQFTGEEPPMQPEPEPLSVTRPVPSPDPKPKSQDAATTNSSNPVESSPAITASEMENFKNDPLIRKALELFKAEILTNP
jgi:DNA polymerase III subunit gamma/tau